MLTKSNSGKSWETQGLTSFEHGTLEMILCLHFHHALFPAPLPNSSSVQAVLLMSPLSLGHTHFLRQNRSGLLFFEIIQETHGLILLSILSGGFQDGHQFRSLREA